jgi:hypothetical protein
LNVWNEIWCANDLWQCLPQSAKFTMTNIIKMLRKTSWIYIYLQICDCREKYILLLY